MEKDSVVRAHACAEASAEEHGGCHQQDQTWHVYILLCSDGTHYTGCSSNITERLSRHNRGEVHYTKSRLPVSLLFYATFTDKYKAYEFEKYLKSGSGRAFSLKHIL